MNKYLKIFNELENTSSTNQKIEIIKKYNNDNIFYNILKYTYQTDYNYYIKKIDLKDINFKNNPKNEFNENIFFDFFKVLDLLRSGTIRGNKTKEILTSFFENYNLEISKFLVKIILKDLRIGVNISLLKKANNIYSEFDKSPVYMRCYSNLDYIKKIDYSNGVFVQEKMDGVYIALECHYSYNDIKDEHIPEFTIKTRNGKELPLDNFKEILNSINLESDIIKNKKNFMLCGELLVYKDNALLDRKTGNGIINSILQKNVLYPNYKFKYIVWDLLLENNEDFHYDFDIPYKDRFKEISYLIEGFSNIDTVNTKEVFSYAEVIDFTSKLQKEGKEGSVLKLKDGVFKNGTSKECFKIKIEFDCDLQIVGLTKGSGKNEKTFGSLICQSADKKLSVNISGFTDKEREDIYDFFEDMYLNKIITVRCNEIIKSKNSETYSMFLPRFVEIRQDKNTADTLDKILNDFNSILQ